jgi:molybdate transport system ATP-binding protein
MIDIDVERRLGQFHLRAQVLAQGHVTAFFGRSGSGKTTLLNMIAGLVRPERGRIAVNGSVLFDSETGVDIAQRKRRIGYVFQEGRLFPHLSVRQNLRYGEWFTAKTERYVGLDHVIQLLGLEYLLSRRPGSLSGGEKQRVALGRALLASPRLLLLDEPLASLDAHRKREILRYIERLRDEIKVPIVYVSHAIEEVVRLADTLVVMSSGQTVAVGSVSDLMSRMELRPILGRFEAGSVIEAKAIAYDADYDLTRLVFTGGELLVANLDALLGEMVRVRIRARDVSLALTPPAHLSILNVLKGEIREISSEPGPIVDVRLRVGDFDLIARITRWSAEQLKLSSGQTVYALVKAISLDRHSFGFA